MFSKSDFQHWARGNVVRFAAVMTKIEGRKDDDLLRTYGFSGFPSMALLDAEGEVVTKKIARDLFSISNTVAASVVHLKIRAQIDAGQDYDRAAWFMARLGMGELNLEDAKAEFAKVQLNADQKRKADQQILVMEVGKLQGSMRGRNSRGGARGAAMDGIYKIFKSGRRLPKSATQMAFFDSMLVEAAKQNSDAAAFNFSYERVHASIVDRIKAYETRIPRMEKDLVKYKDDERRLSRVQDTLDRYKEIVVRGKKDLAELEAHAERFKTQ